MQLPRCVHRIFILAERSRTAVKNLKHEITSVMIEAAAAMLQLKAAKARSLEPWRDALLKLKDGEVEAASEIAARAFHNGADLEDRKTVIDLISKVAIEQGTHDHWFESLLLLAAEGGLSDCAYNVGNLITERASSPADHALANRYYTQAAKNATNPSAKASALVNSCVPIRDGLLTGKPDWKRAVEIYEEAAEMNLAVGMFNAANVSCWLKDNGEFAYAARAVKWLNRLIARFDAGAPFVDIGGDAEVRGVYQMAKSRLAELHASDQVEVVDIDLILEVAATETCPDRATWLRSRAFEHRLRKTAVKAKPAAWENWLSVLSLMGWELACEPTELDLGPDTGDSRLLKFKLENGAPLALAVVDLDEIESNGGVYRLLDLAKSLKDELDGPCLAIGSKGLFVTLNRPEGEKAYTVLVGCGDDNKVDLVPIWPGATAEEVAKQIGRKILSYGEHNTDGGNTIAILVNALGSGVDVDGVHFPEAIYVNVGAYFNSPVLTVEQAIKLGSEASPEEIAEALKGVKEYFAAQAQRKRQYLGLA